MTTRHDRGDLTVVVAPDSFKGSLLAAHVASAMAAGVRDALGERVRVIECPLADGGEGTLDVFLTATGAELITRTVSDALGRDRIAHYALSGSPGAGRRAVIEAAEANGLPHVADVAPDATRADSYGVGQLAAHALEAGATEILLGLGGSASTDGGTGMLRALGVRFLDAHGDEVRRGGVGLADIARIDDRHLHPRAREIVWQVATDVTNPLTGHSGAAHTFGPQKGATPLEVRALDQGLDHLADRLAEHTGTDIRTTPGSGAAGGLPACLLSLLGANLASGIDLVADALQLATACADADLVITGEGSFDSQSLNGKVVDGILRHARPGSPVVVIAGRVKLPREVYQQAGVTAAFSIAPGPAALTELITEASPLVRATAAACAALFAARDGAS
jgi:glycerate kinase